VTTNEILLGVALTLVLAVGSQIIASRIRIPALILLLSAGFIGGALTDDLQPDQLFGDAFEPLVGLAVAVILYDAGLGLDLRRLTGHTRRVVVRLIAFGTAVTWLGMSLVAIPLLDVPPETAIMLGAILVVSGPTVVGPLLDFIRPRERLQRILAWEGSLIDPVGGILGALVFHAVVTSQQTRPGGHLGQFVVSMGIGLLGGVVGTAVLWLLLRHMGLGEVLGTSAQLATVVAVAAGCDMLREDTGLIAAIVMGLALANLGGVEISVRRPFFETTVQLIIGLLFVSISASVSPESLRGLLLPTIGLVAVAALVIRPLVAYVSTLRTDLDRGERMFVGWMAPRGIVAAATATTFSAGLVSQGVDGAEKILPATFLVIVATVMLYGLSAAPVARRLGVLRQERARVLLVGGDPWAVDLGRALRTAGLDTLVWAGPSSQRAEVIRAGLDLAPGESLVDAIGSTEMEGITTVLLLTGEDDFNDVAARILGELVDGQVFRLGAAPDRHPAVAPNAAGHVLFDPALTGGELTRRYGDGQEIVARPAGMDVPPGCDVLFVVRPGGVLVAATSVAVPTPRPGDTVVLLDSSRAGTGRHP
jgi:NhaP-type Na+/H+ or K+/H+ antiporter